MQTRGSAALVRLLVASLLGASVLAGPLGSAASSAPLPVAPYAASADSSLAFVRPSRPAASAVVAVPISIGPDVRDARPARQGAARAGTPPVVANAAADGLDVTTAAVYEVQPAAHRVRVTVDVTAVNQLTDTADTRYYYTGVNLAVQREASAISASEDGRRDRVTAKARDGYRLVAVQFGAKLYAGETVHVRVAFTLAAGAPRSSSEVRVGAAYSTFVAWAFGDRGSVAVRVPVAFKVGTSGGTMTPGPTTGGLQVLTATTGDAPSWYAWVDATDDAALATRRLTLPSGKHVVVRAWPEDRAWERKVASLLTGGIPRLEARIGLPWPIDGDLTVQEVAGALLEGYAGFYAPSTHEITISEDLDPLTIVHEASHVWLNASLFTERWVTEGLADEYALRTLAGLGITAAGPAPVRTTAAAAFPLTTWGPPAPIASRTQDAKEQWAYDASWTLLAEVVSEVGEGGMAKVFAAADAGTTAYVGAGVPEKSRLPNDWRRFVDLTEELAGGSGVAEMIAPWALTKTEAALLAPRAAARTAYHALVAADAGWAAPAVVRTALDGWDFAPAQAAISEAAAVVRTRDAVKAEAAAEHLVAPESLREAYEAAATADALAKVASSGEALKQSLDAVAAADAAVAAPRDWLVGLGLVGHDPAAGLDAARAAWTSGDTASATAAASAVTGQLAIAGDTGRVRVVALGFAVLALLLLVAMATAMVRRRRRRATVDVGDAAPVASEWRPVTPAPEAPSPEASPLDPRLPPPPPGWAGASPYDPSAGVRPYPILPPNATDGAPPEPPAPVADEGAQ